MPTLRSAENKARPPAMPMPMHAEERVVSSATYRSVLSCSLVALMRIAAEHHNQKSAEDQHGGRSGQTNHVGDYRAVTTRLRVVVIAIQHNLIDDSTDLVVRRLNQAQADILGRKLHAVVILSDLARRGHDHDGRG